MNTIFTQPKNTLPSIEEVYLYVSVDAEDGNEGVIAAPMGEALMPMVAADKARLEMLTPIATAIGKAYGIKIRLIRLSNREVIKDIIP